jgi:poly(3-hydroxyalkanoate) depolymerase
MNRRNNLPLSQEPDPNLSMQLLKIGRNRIRVAVRKGATDQTPLLIMNGLGVNLEVLDPFLEAFGDAVKTIRFDPPGIGGSSVPYLPYRLKGLASLVKKILDRLGHQKVDVLGVSWGGGLAQQFARQFPDRCRHLILAATATGSFMIPGRFRTLLKMITPQRFFKPGYLQKIAPELYGGKIREHPELVDLFIHNIRMRGLSGYYFQLLAAMGWTSIHWLHKLRQPTLILAGKDDPIIRPLNAKIMVRQIPNSTLHLFDCGHLFLFTYAKESSEIIHEFNSV